MKLIILFLLPFILLAQEKPDSKPVKEGSSVEIHNQLLELKNLKAEEFDKRIDEYRNSIEKYIEKKKRVCNGEFTTIILSDSKQKPTEQTNKLSADEKKLCFNELKAIYKTYINHLFLVRTRFLEFLNKKRIKELASIRDETLKSIDSTFSRKR